MRYLLGTLSEDERAQLEERYFSDDKEFEEIEIAEEELIDRYVRGELTGADLREFEQTVVRSPRLMERIEFAKLFADRLRPADPPVVVAPVKLRWWERFFAAGRGSQLALACSAAMVLLAFGVLLFGWRQLQQQSRRLAAQQAALEQRQRELDRQAAELAQRVQPTPTETPAPPQVPQEPAPQTGTPLAFTLSPGGTRSTSGPADLRISSGTSEVLLTLNLRDTDYSSYRVILNSPDHKNIFSRSNLKPRVTNKGATLTFRIPAQQLRQGDYYLSVFGGPGNESVDDYPFRAIPSGLLDSNKAPGKKRPQP